MNPNYFPTADDTARAAAALKLIQNFLDTPAYVTDENGYVLTVNTEHESAIAMIRDHLDWPDFDLSNDAHFAENYPELTIDLAQRILDALKLVWEYPYFRDEISMIALSLSLCPLHFVDYAICFEDANDECDDIRKVFPSHDT